MMFQKRLNILYWFIFFLFISILGRAFFMQVIWGEFYDREAKAWRLRKEYVPFHRGRIFDRRGVPLACNQTLYHLSFRPGDFSRESRLWVLARVLEMAEEKGKSAEEKVRAFFAMGKSDFLRTPSDLYRETVIQRAEEILGVKGLSSWIEKGGGIGTFCLGRNLAAEEVCARVHADPWLDHALNFVLHFKNRVPMEEINERLPDIYSGFMNFPLAFIQELAAASREFSLRAAGLFGMTAKEMRRHLKKESGTLADLFPKEGREIWEGCYEEYNDLCHLESLLGMEPGALFRNLDGILDSTEARMEQRLKGYLAEGAVSSRRIEKIMRSLRGDYPFRFSTVQEDGEKGVVFELVLFPEKYPGFFIEEELERVYPFEEEGFAVHLIGGVNQVSHEDLERQEKERRDLEVLRKYPFWTEEEWHRLKKLGEREDKRFLPGEVKGGWGLERFFEETLRGKRGWRKVERDIFSREVTLVDHCSPENGKDLHLTIERGIQSFSEKLLEGKKGAIVLMTVSGEVLALATSPRYTLKELRRDYTRLAGGSEGKLFNRAIASRVIPPPGSLFKVVTAAAALEEGIITPETAFNCQGCLDPANPDRFRCLGIHGEIRLKEAIEHSCNVYFYGVGELLKEKVFVWGKRFGFGKSAGIEVPDAAGRIGFSEGSGMRIYPGTYRLLGIGQGPVEVTPLQAAVMMTAFAGDGSLAKPTLIPSEGRSGNERNAPAVLSEGTRNFMREAMRGVVLRGTASKVELLRDFQAAGKTGTAQVENRETHAWFAGFAPWDQPEVVFCIFLEHIGRGGGEAASPLAGRLLEYYFETFAKEGR